MKALRLSAMIAAIVLLQIPSVFAQSGAAGAGRGRAAPAQVALTIETNVPSATLLVNGQDVKGSWPRTLQVAPGSYTIQVTAAGYQPFNQTVNVTSAQTINANLNPITYSLTVTSNVAGTVLVNGSSIGQTTANTALAPGTYNVTVQAPGFFDFTTSINLNGNQTVNAQLRPATASVSFQIPQQMLDQSNPAAQGLIQIFIDGRPLVQNSGEVQPGRRTVRVRSGGLVYEFIQDFQAGQSYTITPNFSASIR